jgi:hypothetical protein
MDATAGAVTLATVTPRELERAAGDVVLTVLAAASAAATLGRIVWTSTSKEPCSWRRAMRARREVIIVTCTSEAETPSKSAAKLVLKAS